MGKSVIFSKLTGTNVTSSNYPGTTVEFTRGKMKWNDQIIEVIDVPGTYTLEPTNKAEEVAAKMLDQGDLIVNVVDATNLERNLNLTLQLLERNTPLIVALNFWDEAQQKGIEINIEKLQQHLRVPVIPTVATKGNGIKDIIEKFNCLERPNRREAVSKEKRWADIGRISEDVQQISHRHPTWLDIFEDMTIRPVTGIPVMVVILLISFLSIRIIGEGLINYVTVPLFDTAYKPFLLYLSDNLHSQTLLHDLLLGQMEKGDIDLESSFGLLTTSIFVPIAVVLPYIIAFYLVLGLLEDTGYLPRLSVLADNIMHKVGLHGFSIIPMILGFGCNVPAALATRSLESRREKFITGTLMAIAIPCMAQTAMIVGLLGPHGAKYIAYIFIILGFIWVILGLILNKVLPGFSSDLLLEIPPFRSPELKSVVQKLWIRVRSFLREAILYMLLGVFIVNVLYVLGTFNALAPVTGPLLNKFFGLPNETIAALLMGFLRKDLAMGMLLPLDLSPNQLVVASTILVIYFPCVATFAVLIKELGIVDMIKSTLIMISTAFIVGGLVNVVFQYGGPVKIGWLSIILIIVIYTIIKYLPDRVEKNDDLAA